MSGLVFTLKSAPRFGVDCAELTPVALAGKTLREIAALPLPGGESGLRVGDLFRINGKADGEALVLRDATSRLVGVGSGMTGGTLRVEGSLGEHAGRRMRAGTLWVAGNVGDGAACGMRGGLIEVGGSAGDYLGGPTPGDVSGMRGGTVLVVGSVGNRCGDRLRRGLIVVGKQAGDYCASQMVAGTVLVRGSCGPGAGFGMRRGSLLIGQPLASPLAGFALTGTYALPFLPLLLRHIAAFKPRWRNSLAAFDTVQRWVGDAGNGGLGEILLPG